MLFDFILRPESRAISGRQKNAARCGTLFQAVNRAKPVHTQNKAFNCWQRIKVSRGVYLMQTRSIHIHFQVWYIQKESIFLLLRKVPKNIAEIHKAVVASHKNMGN